MATPLISGSLALLFNRYGDLSPIGYKEKLKNACIALNDTKDSQGAGMLNLKELFDIEEKADREEPTFSKESKGELFETIIVFLIIIFLLDSRI